MEALGIILLLAVGAVLLGRWNARYKKRYIERKRQRTRDGLVAKYGDGPYIDEILAGRVWIGMTAEQLVDAWGPPVAIDTRRLKTKVSQTYKYVRTRRRGFRQRVKVDDGIVVGWTNN